MGTAIDGKSLSLDVRSWFEWMFGDTLQTESTAHSCCSTSTQHATLHDLRLLGSNHAIDTAAYAA
jgi:hypothetical protein